MQRLAICLGVALAVMISIPCTAVAASMDEFIRHVLDWTGPERPQLIISRGLLLTWLTDPPAYRPANPGGFFWNGDQPKIIVPPGMPLMVFPPRFSEAVDQHYPDRLKGSHYQLAVTQDGFWGVIDVTQSRSFLSEPDLQKIARLESPDSSDALFGILVDVTANLCGSSGAITRGEVFRIANSTTQAATISFDSDVARMRDKQADLVKACRVEPPIQFELDPGKTRFIAFRVRGDLVPDDLIDDWLANHGVYSKIFEGSFSSLTVPDAVQIQQGCGKETTIKSRSEKEAHVAGEGSLSLGASIFTFLKGKLDLSAGGKANVSQTIDSVTTVKAEAREMLYLIDYKNRDNPETTFWAGTARTCNDPIWSTLEVRTGDDQRFLHTSFYQLSSGVHPAAPTSDHVQDELNKLAPGGNPWDPSAGTFRTLCFSQQLALESLANHEMADAATHLYMIRAALALLTTFPSIDNSQQLGRFVGSEATCSPTS